MYIYGVTIFVRKRGDPEDWSVSADTSHSDLYCGVNVPDETGKMSRSDKRGATLPKVAAVATLPRNDNCVMLSASETSPGKAKPADLILQ